MLWEGQQTYCGNIKLKFRIASQEMQILENISRLVESAQEFGVAWSAHLTVI